MDLPVDASQCASLIRTSCVKIVTSRNQKGGPKLHKNLLILSMLRRTRELQIKYEEAAHMAVLFDDDEDDEVSPPLEFSVTDADSSVDAHLDGESLSFACEATEEEPQPLSPAIDDALRQADRKRKAAERPDQRKKKVTSTAVATSVDRTVPQLRALSCK